MKQWIVVILMVMLGSSLAFGASDGLQEQVQMLQQRVAELEAQQSQQAVQERNAELLRQMMSEFAKSSARQSEDTAITAGYDKRFFIKSADDQFSLQFDTLMQFRYSYLCSDDGNTSRTKEGLVPAAGENGVDSSASAFEAERARLQMSGHVLKDLNYMIQLEMDDDNSNNTYLLDYVLDYSFMPEFGLKAGRYKGAFGKQWNTSASKMMLVDRSLATAVFNVGRSTGLEAFGELPLGDSKLHYRAGMYNGINDTTSRPFAENDNNPAVAARLALPLMGATPADFENESDIEGHENPVAQIGASFVYGNNQTEDQFAGGNDDNFIVLLEGGDGRSNGVCMGGEATMLGLDASYKWSGLSVTMEGFYQHADLDGTATYANQFGADRDILGVTGLEMDNYGWYTQAGYFLVPGTFELVSRVGGVCIDGANDSHEYTGGWNYYISGQDLKLSMDLTYIDDLPITNSSLNYDGVQNNALFLVRTQLQFMF
jgi:hypothetical protein